MTNQSGPSSEALLNLVGLLSALIEALGAHEQAQRPPAKALADVSVRQSEFDGDLPALMPVPDAAKMLGISRASAYRYADAGLLPTRRFGRRVYVVREQLRALVVSGPAKTDVQPDIA